MARGRILTREQIDDLDNHQTGRGTAMEAAGGYRCRHHWRAVRPTWFDADGWRELTGEDKPEARKLPPLAEAQDDPAAATARRAELVSGWSPATARGDELQQAAHTAFDVEGLHFTDFDVQPAPNQLAFDEDDLRAIYQDTQQQFAAGGVDVITLHRPITDDLFNETPGIMDLWQNTEPQGDYITEEFPARQVLFTPNNAGGSPGSYTVLRSTPRTRFDAAATADDPTATASRFWSAEVVRTQDGHEGRLVHKGTGEVVAKGRFSRADLEAHAGQLERYLGSSGSLPDEGTSARGFFEEERESITTYTQRRRHVPVGPDYRDVDTWLDLGGIELPVIQSEHATTKAASARKHKTRWSRTNELRFHQGDGSIKQAKGYVRGNFGIFSTLDGAQGIYDVQHWWLVHAPTGTILHHGSSFADEEGGIPVGGWSLAEFKRQGDRLEQYIDKDGTVFSDKRVEWKDALIDLARQTQPGVDVRDVTDRQLSNDMFENAISSNVRPQGWTVDDDFGNFDEWSEEPIIAESAADDDDDWYPF